MIPPITLNFFRWVLAFAILLPWPMGAAQRQPLWPHWRRYAVLGLLGIGLYNALQYMALQTPPHQRDAGGLQHAGVDAGRGALFFGASVTRQQLVRRGALHWVLIVLSRGSGTSCWPCGWCPVICSC